MSQVIYACDIGSVKSGAFAWARITPDEQKPETSREIEELLPRIEADARQGRHIALGFESPLFMPIPENSSDLSQGRENEGARSMFAPAGGYVTTLGLHEMAWILGKLQERCGHLLTYTLESSEWQSSQPTPVLFLWEAFVSEGAHGETHEQDAISAAEEFRKVFQKVPATEVPASKVKSRDAQATLSLAHVAALWSGWATDHDRLTCEALVIKPEKPNHLSD